MKTDLFVRRSKVAASADEVYAWHARPGAFERLTPPWEPVEVVERVGGVEGGRVVFEMKVGPLRTRWVAEHVAFERGRMFLDVQSKGPFASWEHTHQFIPVGEDASILEDRIRYAPPLGALGRFVSGRFIRRKLQRMFAYRHRTTVDDLAMHRRFSGPPLRVLVLGTEGPLGSSMAALLSTGGHCVRGAASLSGEVSAEPSDVSESFDAVVELQCLRSNAARRENLLNDRLRQIHRTVELVNRLPQHPKVVVAASSAFASDQASDPASFGKCATAWEEAGAPLLVFTY